MKKLMERIKAWYFKPVDIFKTKRFWLTYSLDTWWTPRGYDKLLTNFVRILSMLGLIIIIKEDLTRWVEYPLFVIVIWFIGVTEIKFFRNKQMKLEIRVW